MSNTHWPIFLLILVVTGKSINEDQSFENIESSEEYDLINPNLNDVIEAMQELDYIDKDIIKEKDLGVAKNMLGLLKSGNEPVYEYDIIEDSQVEYDSSEEILSGEYEIDNADNTNLIVDYEYNLPDLKTFVQDLDIKEFPGLEETGEIDWVPNVPDYDYFFLHAVVSQDPVLDDEVEDDTFDMSDVNNDDHSSLVSTKFLKKKIEEIYEQQQIFHIILLLGVSMITVVVFSAFVSLVVSIITKKFKSNISRNNYDFNNNIPTKIHLKSNGIIKSYTKLPVEIKNMLPNNVAYQQLYDA